MLIERPMQQRRQHHGVTEAADREQFGGTLHDGDDDGLKRAHAAFLTEGGRFGKVAAKFPVIASGAKRSRRGTHRDGDSRVASLYTCPRRHGGAWPRHPRLPLVAHHKTWMAGTRPRHDDGAKPWFHSERVGQRPVWNSQRHPAALAKRDVAGHDRRRMAHHHHDHAHPHLHHGHSHHGQRHDRAFAIGTALNIGFVAAEIRLWPGGQLDGAVGGCGPQFRRRAGPAARLGRTWLTRLPTRRRTYGWGRSSILAALLNATILLIGVGAIGVEAVQLAVLPGCRWGRLRSSWSPQPASQ